MQRSDYIDAAEKRAQHLKISPSKRLTNELPGAIRRVTAKVIMGDQTN